VNNTVNDLFNELAQAVPYVPFSARKRPLRAFKSKKRGKV
jgi:hypothetical protein